MILSKICRACKKEKSLSDFYTNNRWKDKLERRCKKCLSSQAKRRYWKNPEKYLLKNKNSKYGKKGSVFAKARRLKKAYNLPIKIWNTMFKHQEGKCAICDASALVVDHNHDTKEIRALLCHKCNRGLGHFYDNVELLRKAARYLEDPVAVISEKKT